jgi:hypothetical protein
MSDHERLFEAFLPRILAEFRRIGFTEEDLRFLGFGFDPAAASEAAYLAALADLQTVPTGLGADAFCAQSGIDLAELKREAYATLRGHSDT